MSPRTEPVVPPTRQSAHPTRPPRVRAFAPVGGELPARVRFAAWYFSVTGALGLALMVVAVGAALLGVSPFADVDMPVLGVALNVLPGIGWLWTGRLLAAGERSGGAAAWATLLLPALARVAGEPVPAGTLVVGAVGSVMILAAWRDLR